MARICPRPTCGKLYGDGAEFCGVCGTGTVADEASDPRIGQTLGQYQVVARIADGAMGRVYEGRRRDDGTRVAIKVLHPEVAGDAVAVERLRREFEAMRELESPYIVDVLEFGTAPDGQHFMAMEYLEGEELGLVLRRGQPLEPARLVRIFAQLALGLDHAHSFGLIHRDLKPDNIFLCRSEQGDVVRILDFGSVKLQIETGPKLTAFGTTLGSPYYMSPEQALGRPDVDLRTDVFALGAIAYECATGKIAFEAPSVAQILMQIVNTEPAPASQVRPGLPPRLDDVLERALRKDKRTRQRSASAFVCELCDAYGLAPELERWASTSERELARLLADSTPPAAVAFAAAPLRESPFARGSAAPGALNVPRHSGMLLGLAAITLTLAAVMVALLLR